MRKFNYFIKFDKKLSTSMNFTNLLRKIFELKDFEERPPILIDIGASESIHKFWKYISKYSICIAFDADNRELGYTEKITKDFKKLFVFNCIVTDTNENISDFYLTKSPYCSSTLPPLNEKLEGWAYAEKFQVQNKVIINSKSLMASLVELKINHIDWFKSDSQGIDLRLFKSLSENIRNNILVAEFEPGLIDSYKGEDKLSKLISFFETEAFWLSDFIVKGSQRIAQFQLETNFKSKIIRKLAQFSHKSSPGWAELIYIKEFEELKNSMRRLILGWVFSTILDRHGYALLLADKMILKNVDDPDLITLIDKMKRYSKNKLQRNIISLRFLPSVFLKIKQSFRIY